MEISTEQYQCPGCGKVDPAIARELKANLCPYCGTLLPVTVHQIDEFFRIIQLTSKLDGARRLILKSELISGIREALTVFETIVRDKSGLADLTGVDLMAKAFSFEKDADTGAVTRAPRVPINSLETLSQKNEQEGITFLAMGLMQGVRNIYMHSEGSERIYFGLQIVVTVDLLLKQILRQDTMAPKRKH